MDDVKMTGAVKTAEPSAADKAAAEKAAVDKAAADQAALAKRITEQIASDKAAADKAAADKTAAEKLAADKGKLRGGAEEFDPSKLFGNLDALSARFGKEAVAAALRDFVGPDPQAEQVAARVKKLELQNARAQLALTHKLSAEEAAAIPGETPEQLQAAVEYAVAHSAAAAKAAAAGAEARPTSQSAMPARSFDASRSRKPKTLEEAEAAFYT